MKLKEFLNYVGDGTLISVFKDRLFIQENQIYFGKAGELLDNELLNKNVFQVLPNKYLMVIVLI